MVRITQLTPGEDVCQILFMIQGRHGVHIFKDLIALKWAFLKLTADFRSQDSFNLSASRILFDQLQNCSFSSSWIIRIKSPQYYRRVGSKRDVLDTAGSLANGGRHNIGGAQSSSNVRNIFHPIGNKRSALYLGEDPVNVRLEFGDYEIPKSNAITYLVTLKRRKSLLLVDADKALHDLSSTIPDIVKIVGTASMNGKWEDLKQPAPCQIFGHWLIQNAPANANGIIFSSAHGSHAKNVCLYFDDTKACKKLLKGNVAI